MFTRSKGSKRLRETANKMDAALALVAARPDLAAGQFKRDDAIQARVPPAPLFSPAARTNGRDEFARDEFVAVESGIWQVQLSLADREADCA
jgi:hypothetical protein